MNLKHAAFRTVSHALGVMTASAPPPGLRILMYHAVGTALPSDPYGTSISERDFRAHLAAYDRLREEFPPAPFGPAASGAPAAAFTFDDGYRDTLTVAAPLLASRGIPFSVFVPPGHVGDASGLYLDKSQLRELAALDGVSIGAHGDRHAALTGLDDGALAAELAESRKRLEDILGAPVDSMSYPFGRVDRRVRDAAAAAGFKTAGCSLYGSNDPARDPLLLKRTEIVAWDTAGDFESKLRGRWDWFALRQGDPAS